MIYICVFIISAFFGRMAQKSKTKRKAYCFIVIAALVPAVLAGLRATSVGTDVELYVVDNFRLARNSKSFIYCLAHTYAKEPLYVFLVYLSSRLSSSVQTLLFLLNWITMLCISGAAYRFRKHVAIDHFLILYFFLFYNETYNAVRQHLAISIILLGLIYLLKGEYKRFLPYLIIATLFHYTSILAGTFIFIHWFLSSKYFKGYKKLNRALVVIVTMIICFIPEYIYGVFVKLGILSERYRTYFNAGSVSYNLTLTLILLFEVLLVYFITSVMRKRIWSFDYLKINAVVALLLLQLSRVMFYGNRISLYFIATNIILTGQVDKICNSRRNRQLIRLIIDCIYLFYWYYVYIHGGASGTYPYVLAA